MISYVPWFITLRLYTSFFVFFFNDTATTEIYTLSLHDALPILIVSEDGYLLTNNHVVDGADEIKVEMSDEKTVLEAKVIGTDPHTDIAVIKVEGKKLPAIAITDSDNVEVGDLVMAVGNPFGVGQTVTSGIV